MNSELLQTLTVDQYPFDPHYAQGLRTYFSHFLRELTDEEKKELGGITFCPLLFGNRSGSNLLTHSLYQAGLGFPEHGEPMNLPSIEKIATRQNLSSFTDYFLFLIRRWRKQDISGFKISVGQLFDLSRTGLLDSLKDIKLLHSVRRDRVAQAVSHYLAKESGKWSSKEGDALVSIPYSAESILRFMRRAARLQADYDLYKTIHQIDGLEIVFEDFIANPRQHIAEIAEFLGCTAELDAVDLTSAGTKPQSNPLNREYARRFRSEMRASGQDAIEESP